MVQESKITMAHGSGGKSSAQLMADVFGKYFKNEILDKMEDAGVLELTSFAGEKMDASVGSRLAVSTDSFVVMPPVFKGGDIGKLSVCGTVNDLLMMGAEPKYITCGFILEEGLDIRLLEQIVASMAEEAQQVGVLIVAGDTKVVEGSGGLYINTTGIGMIPKGREISGSNCKAGDAIILSGTLGDHHACILSHRMEIDNDISSDCAVLKDVTDALFENHVKIKAMRDVTRGGLGTILNELADSSGCMAEIFEEKIPVKEQVRGFADILGLEPLYMGNEGKLIAVVDPQDAEKALEAMKQTVHGKDAAIIGHMKEGGGVYLKTRLGATRKVDVLYGEGLPRIC